MATISDLINNIKSLLGAAVPGSLLVLRKYGTLESAAEIESAVQGPNGGLAVEDPVLAGATHTIAVTATTYSPALRVIRNNGSAGLIAIKGSADSAATNWYIPQGGELTSVQVKEVTSIAAGMDCVGGY